MLESIQHSAAYIKNRIGDFEPEIGIILGTGLGGLVKEIEIEKQLLYANIPDFPISTLEFHSGKLIFGARQRTANARQYGHCARAVCAAGCQCAGATGPFVA